MRYWWLGLAVAVIFSAWTLSYTRNAWVGGIAGFMALGLMKGKSVLIGSVLVIVGTLLVMTTFEPAFQDRVESIADPSFSSNRERINMGRVTFDMFKDAPLLGVGGGNYGQASEPYRPKYNVISTSSPHNNLYTQVAEKGILGLGAFIYMWYVFF